MKSIAGLRSPHPRLLPFHEERSHLCLLRCQTFLCAVPRMGKAHSPSFLQEPLRACSARARGSFLVEKKGTKDSPKRKFPLWNLLLGDSPLGNFARRSSLPLTAPAAGECQVLHLSLRAVSSYVVAVTFLGVGFQKGLAPFVGGVGTKRSQLNLCLLSFHKKVGAGAGRVDPQYFCR